METEDLHDKCEKVIKASRDYKDFKPEAFAAFCQNMHIEDPDLKDLKQADDAYVGEYRDAAALAEDILQNTGDIAKIPDYLQSYLDIEAYGRDMILGGDYWNEGRHFFRNT